MADPRTLILQLSYACTHACVFCSESRSRSEFKDHPLRGEEIARVLVTKKREGFDDVIITGGGEPTLHPRFLAILKALRGRGFSVCLTSNGWRLSDPAFARSVLPLLDRLCLSVHGDGAGLHDAATGRRGSFARLVRALANARGEGKVRLETYTVVSRSNWKSLPKLLRSLSGKSVRSAVLSQLVPEGAACAGYRELVVPLSEWRREAPGLAALCAELGLELRFLNLPSCVLGPAAALSDDRRFARSVSVGRGLAGGRPTVLEVAVGAPSGDLEGRTHPACCSDCRERAACAGVHKRYLDEFGDGELIPVRDGAKCVSDRLGGEPGQWRRFLCGKEFLRARHWISPTRSHGAHECPLACPDAVLGGASFFSYPPIFLPCKQAADFAPRVRALAKRPAAEGPAVGLVDCPDAYFREELGPGLSRLGVRVAARLQPSLRGEDLAAYAEASIQVVPDYLRNMEPLGAILAALPMKTVFAPAPYGAAGSRDFMRAVARAAGKLDSFDREWEAIRRPLDPAWRALRREAGSFRLAIAADEDALSVLTQESFQVGLPVPRMLGEMGFDLDYLLFDTPNARRAVPALRNCGWFDRPPEVFFFRTPRELKRLLEDPRRSAVYSDIFSDRRLTEAGKTPFSMALFEPGLRGSLRTLRRLLDACRTPFYKTYGRFLKTAERS